MRRLDKLVLGELFGPWCFGVAIFTVLIMAGSFLFQLTRYLSEGADPLITVQLTIFLLPGVLVKTFSMAMLLASLLAFGRLSGDSEIVALKAGGVSVGRIMLPVAMMGFSVALLAFIFGEFVVPNASYRAVSLRTTIEKQLDKSRQQSTSYPLMENGKMVGYLLARDYSIGQRKLYDATIVAYGEDERPANFLQADELEYSDIDNWRIIGAATLYSAERGTKVEFKDGVWPTGIPKPQVTLDNLIAQTLRDLDAFSMTQMKEEIKKEKEKPNPDLSQVANLEFGYWNKITLPLAALVFGLVGAPLGIRSHRTGAATGFWLSVVIIFGYLLLTNVMSIMAQGGAVPSYVASFGPIVIGLIVGISLIQKRNR